MGGSLLVHPLDARRVLRVELLNPGKQNAISVAMWRELRALFASLQAEAPEQAPRAVLITGAGGHFAAGADIEEFPQFRFHEDTLRDYHEDVIAPALQALLDCDIPVVARIEGSCVGGGLEIAACCDLRIAAASARFGAPIARLGFPMAPGELLALSRVVPAATLRELLLEARLLDAPTALARGLVHRVVDDSQLDTETEATLQRIVSLSPHAARLNKQTLRQIARGGPTSDERRHHFAYAGHPEHREGIEAFLAKRPPNF
jgi:enoyl-CoA hydratase/carnithine racemase